MPKNRYTMDDAVWVTIEGSKEKHHAYRIQTDEENQRVQVAWADRGDKCWVAMSNVVPMFADKNSSRRDVRQTLMLSPAFSGKGKDYDHEKDHNIDRRVKRVARKSVTQPRRMKKVSRKSVSTTQPKSKSYQDEKSETVDEMNETDTKRKAESVKNEQQSRRVKPRTVESQNKDSVMKEVIFIDDSPVHIPPAPPPVIDLCDSSSSDENRKPPSPDGNSPVGAFVEIQQVNPPITSRVTRKTERKKPPPPLPAAAKKTQRSKMNKPATIQTKKAQKSKQLKRQPSAASSKSKASSKSHGTTKKSPDNVEPRFHDILETDLNFPKGKIGGESWFGPKFANFPRLLQFIPFGHEYESVYLRENELIPLPTRFLEMPRFKNPDNYCGSDDDEGYADASLADSDGIYSADEDL